MHSVYTGRCLKYAWPFYNTMHESVKRYDFILKCLELENIVSENIRT